MNNDLDVEGLFRTFFFDINNTNDKNTDNVYYNNKQKSNINYVDHNIIKIDNELHCQFIFPVKPSDLMIFFENNILSISVNKQTEESNPFEYRYVVKTFDIPTMKCAVEIPKNYEYDSVKFENGLLTVVFKMNNDKIQIKID